MAFITIFPPSAIPSLEADPNSLHLNGDNSPSTDISWDSNGITNLSNLAFNGAAIGGSSAGKQIAAVESIDDTDRTAWQLEVTNSGSTGSRSGLRLDVADGGYTGGGFQTAGYFTLTANGASGTRTANGLIGEAYGNYLRKVGTVGWGDGVNSSYGLVGVQDEDGGTAARGLGVVGTARSASTNAAWGGYFRIGTASTSANNSWRTAEVVATGVQDGKAAVAADISDSGQDFLRFLQEGQQSWAFDSKATNNLHVAGLSSGQASIFSFSNADADGSDDLELRLYRVNDAGNANSEYLTLWQPNIFPGHFILSGKTGTGVVRPVYLTTDATVTNQTLQLNPTIADGGDGNVYLIGENQVNIYANSNSSPREVRITQGVMGPGTNGNVDLGSTSLQWNNVYSSGAYFVDNTQVISNRVTGYTDPTGTTDRGTFDTTTVSTQDLAEFVKALYEDLKAHGLIGN